MQNLSIRTAPPLLSLFDRESEARGPKSLIIVVVVVVVVVVLAIGIF